MTKISAAFAAHPVTVIQDNDLLPMAVSDGAGGYLAQDNATKMSTVAAYIAAENRISVANTYYVEVDGNDTTGTGSIASPLATGQKAIDLITIRGDASTANPYLIAFGAGTFVGSMELPPNIGVSGHGIYETYIGALTLTAAWNSVSLPLTKLELTDFSLTDNLNFDLTSALSSARRYWLLKNINFTNNASFTFKGFSDAAGPRDLFITNQVDVTNNSTSAGATLLNTAEFILNSLTTSSCAFNNISGGYTSAKLYNFAPVNFPGVVAFTNPVSANSMSIEVYASPMFFYAAACSGSGASLNVGMDINSRRSITLSGGATTSYLTASTGTGSVVLATSPILVTPNLGVATATSINGTPIPTSKTLVSTLTGDTGGAIAPSANNITFVGSGITIAGAGSTLTFTAGATTTNAPANYITGLQLSTYLAAPGLAVEIAPGSCMDSTNTYQIDLSFTSNFTDGNLDTGSWILGARYYAYICDNPSSPAPIFVVSLSPTTPDLSGHPGYTKFRYVGYCQSDSRSTAFDVFIQEGNSTQRNLTYVSGDSTKFQVITTASSASPALVACAGCVSANATRVKIAWQGSVGGMALSIYASLDTSVLISTFSGGSGGIVPRGVFEIVLDSSQQFYYSTTGAGTVSMQVVGFTEYL